MIHPTGSSHLKTYGWWGLHKRIGIELNVGPGRIDVMAIDHLRRVGLVRRVSLARGQGRIVGGPVGATGERRGLLARPETIYKKLAHFNHTHTFELKFSIGIYRRGCGIMDHHNGLLIGWHLKCVYGRLALSLGRPLLGWRLRLLLLWGWGLRKQNRLFRSNSFADFALPVGAAAAAAGCTEFEREACGERWGVFWRG